MVSFKMACSLLIVITVLGGVAKAANKHSWTPSVSLTADFGETTNGLCLDIVGATVATIDCNNLQLHSCKNINDAGRDTQFELTVNNRIRSVNYEATGCTATSDPEQGGCVEWKAEGGFKLASCQDGDAPEQMFTLLNNGKLRHSGQGQCLAKIGDVEAAGDVSFRADLGLKDCGETASNDDMIWTVVAAEMCPQRGSSCSATSDCNVAGLGCNMRCRNDKCRPCNRFL